MNNGSPYIPPQRWGLYRPVIEDVQRAGLRFALGGGFAYSVYARRPRDTRDIDLFVRPQDREKLIRRVNALGFEDYHSRLPYDRSWIYRGYREGMIVDVIWQMVNRVSQVDDQWLDRAVEFNIHALPVRVLAVEELVWSKLYVLQRDRCDWPDLLSLLASQGPRIDWPHLLRIVDSDAALLGGVLSVFKWLCPAEASLLPAWIWPQMNLLPPEGEAPCESKGRRAALLDSRDWFGPIAEASS